MFKDVYREVGILEVFVTCLTRYSEFLSKPTNEEGIGSDENEILGRMVLESLVVLLNGNNNNANVFRESGGAKCIHDMVKFEHCRTEALAIIRELMLSPSGEDDMLVILSTMHSAPTQNVQMKIQILRTLLGCLRDSHRTRTIFRKVGGFVYVTSVLVSLDGKLTDDYQTSETKDINEKNLLQLLQIVCHTLVTAMRFEPANAKYFHQEICSASLCDTLRLLGCFGTRSEIENTTNSTVLDDRKREYFQSVFIGNILEPIRNETIPISLIYACIVYRLLYDIALDNFENGNLSGVMNIVTLNHSNPTVHAKVNYDKYD